MQNHCILGSIKWMDLLNLIMELFDYWWFNKSCDRIKNLFSEKLLLSRVLITILEKSELIQIIFYLLKKY